MLANHIEHYEYPATNLELELEVGHLEPQQSTRYETPIDFHRKLSKNNKTTLCSKLEWIHSNVADLMVFEEIEWLDDLSNNEISIIKGIY